MESKNENLGLALFDSLQSDHLEELGVDIVELAADSITQADFIAEIPIVGMFYKAGKAAIAIRDKIFLRKVLTFLNEHQNISLADRVKFLSQFETEQQKQEFGETVIMLLDSVNHIKKAQIIGKLSRALLLGLITQSDFFVLSESVDKLYIDDLSVLKEIYKAQKEPETEQSLMTYTRLFNAGLLNDVPSRHKTVIDGTPPIADNNINHYGKKLVEIVLLNNELIQTNDVRDAAD